MSDQDKEMPWGAKQGKSQQKRNIIMFRSKGDDDNGNDERLTTHDVTRPLRSFQVSSVRYFAPIEAFCSMPATGPNSILIYFHKVP